METRIRVVRVKDSNETRIRVVRVKDSNAAQMCTWPMMMILPHWRFTRLMKILMRDCDGHGLGLAARSQVTVIKVQFTCVASSIDAEAEMGEGIGISPGSSSVAPRYGIPLLMSVATATGEAIRQWVKQVTPRVPLGVAIAIHLRITGQQTCASHGHYAMLMRTYQLHSPAAAGCNRRIRQEHQPACQYAHFIRHPTAGLSNPDETATGLVQSPLGPNWPG